MTHFETDYFAGDSVEYRYTATGLSIDMQPGHYWLAFALDRTELGGGESAVDTTGGAKGIGSPVHNGQAYVYAPSEGYDMDSIDDIEAASGNPGTYDASYGIDATVVPEPASLTALGCGLLAVVRKRRRNAAMSS